MSVAILAQAILVQSLRGSARCPSSQSCEGGLPCLPPAPAASRDGGGLGIHAASASAQSPAEIVGAPVGQPTRLAPGPSGRSHPGPLGSREVGLAVCLGAGRTLLAESTGLVAHALRRLPVAIDGGLLVRLLARIASIRTPVAAGRTPSSASRVVATRAMTHQALPLFLWHCSTHESGQAARRVLFKPLAEQPTIRWLASRPRVPA